MVNRGAILKHICLSNLSPIWIFHLLQNDIYKNPEVVGSSPASATSTSSDNGFRYRYFSFFQVRYEHPHQKQNLI